MTDSSMISPVTLLSPLRLRCEYECNPIGVGSERPRLLWALAPVSDDLREVTQSAYQIQAASSREALEAGKPDLWESGQVESEASQQADYDGSPLASLQAVFWRVRVWDGTGAISPWSEIAHWTMGLRSKDWKGEWITRSWEGPTRPSCTGFCSVPTRTREAQQVIITFDLGNARRLDRVALYPVEAYFQTGALGGVKNRHGKIGPGWGFPHAWVLEGAQSPSFETPVQLAAGDWDRVGFEDGEAMERDIASEPLRYCRLRIVRSGEVRFGGGESLEKLRPLLRMADDPFADDAEEGSFYCNALAEIELWSGGKNVALTAKVEAPSSLELPELGFGLARLTDGSYEAVESLPFVQQLLPVPHFRKEFEVTGAVHRAALTYTAVGLCALELNGQPVGEELTLEPGWTFTRKWYDKEPGWVIVKSREVTHLLMPGANGVGAMLGDGWQRSRGSVRWNGRNHCKGHRTALRLQLDIEYADGRRECIGSGPDWQVFTDGPWRDTSMFDGVRYDARRSISGWSTAGFDASDWGQAALAPEMKDLDCVPLEGPAIGVVAKLPPVRVTEPRKGVWIIDFGQNMAGVCHVVLEGPSGRQVRIRHAQELREDGTLFLSHLGNAWRNSDDYILDGNGPLRIVPRFTFHGFRYVQVEGLGAREELREIEAWVLADSLRKSGHFESADLQLNQLWTNLEWTVRSVLKSVVMDCVGRDERRGWMADGIGNLATHAYCFDFSNFTQKVLRDIRYEQTPSGIFDPVAPWGCVVENYAAGWCDHGVTTAANVLAHYGDTRKMEVHYAAMERFMQRLTEKFPDGVVRDDGGLFWGDWLSFFMTHQAPEGEGKALARQPSREVFGTAWWYATTQRMAGIASVLGKAEEAQRWTSQAEWIRQQFREQLIGADGVIGAGTVSMVCDTMGRSIPADVTSAPPRGGQGEIALALYMGLLEGEEEKTALADLLEAIRAYRGKLSTGIHCTARLLMALTDRGEHALAYRLVMDPSYPSYGYMMQQGATTIWESWDHWLVGSTGVTHPTHGIHDTTHPGLSGVGEWVFSRIAGIRPMLEYPGFRRFTIEPHAEAGPEWVDARLDTVRGEVRCRWQRLGEGDVVWEIVIPPNTEAEVVLPVEVEELVESDQPVSQAPGIRQIIATGTGGSRCLCGSGRYRFSRAVVVEP